MIYGHRFQSIYPDAKSMALAKREWAQALGTVQPERIAAALDKLVADGGAWPPSLPEFIALCKPSPAELGVPEPNAALAIVCAANIRRLDVQQTLADRWKHPVIFHAARDERLDIYNLRQQPTEKALKAWAPIYEQYLQRLADGEQFAWPEEPALEDNTRKAVTPLEKAEARYRTQKAFRCMKAILSGRLTDMITDWQRVHGMRRYV